MPASTHLKHEELQMHHPHSGRVLSVEGQKSAILNLNTNITFIFRLHIFRTNYYGDGNGGKISAIILLTLTII